MKEFREMFGRCHVVLVPTRSSYSEGFNAVVAEAILSGRPVITSKLCPAIELVRDAVVEVPGYVDRNGINIPVVGDLPLGCDRSGLLDYPWNHARPP
jgi:glycosyltransferase involved in cell wall biosynthesis